MTIAFTSLRTASRHFYRAVSLDMQAEIIVRQAVASEQKQLEALQWRASLNKPGDRDALLAYPDSIELPLE